MPPSLSLSLEKKGTRRPICSGGEIDGKGRGWVKLRGLASSFLILQIKTHLVRFEKKGEKKKKKKKKGEPVEVLFLGRKPAATPWLYQ